MLLGFIFGFVTYKKTIGVLPQWGRRTDNLGFHEI